MIKNLKNSPMILSLGVNITFLLLFIVLGSCRFSSMDDFFMSSILSGAYGGAYDVHTYFVNALYGYFLKPFYSLFPSVGWYYIFEIAEVFASFVAIVCVLFSRLGLRFGGLLSLLLLSCVAPAFYFQADFTRNAAVLTAAGMMLLVLGYSEKKKYLAWGVPLAFVGFIMRKDAFYLGLPCLGIMLLFRWIEAGSFKKIPWMNLVAIAICGLMAFAAMKFDRSLYQEGEYKYYAEYQGPRAVFGDGMYYDYDAAVDEIEERELHGLDFELLTDWVFYDTEVLKKDSLYKYIKVINRNRNEVTLSKMPFAVIRELSRSLHETRTWIWIILCIVLLISARKFYRFVPWCSLGYVILAYTYLLLLNRVVEHVETSIWIYATTSVIPFLDRGGMQSIKFPKNMGRIVVAFALLLYAIGFINVPEHAKASCFHEPDDARWAALMQFEKTNSDRIFIFDFTAYKRFTRRLDRGFKALPPGRLDRIIPLGYWNVHFPGMKRSLEKLGIENPMRSIVHPNAYVVQYLDAEKFMDFLKMHYGINVACFNLHWTDVSGKEFTSFDVLKYYLRKESSNE